MSRPIIAISIGVTVGTALGFLLVVALTLLLPPEREPWSVYVQPESLTIWQYFREPAGRNQLFLGLLLGGGFGALTGSAVSIRNTIIRAVRESRA